MIAAPVQCDVDGIPKGSHYARAPPMAQGRRSHVRAVNAMDELLGDEGLAGALVALRVFSGAGQDKESQHLAQSALARFSWYRWDFPRIRWQKSWSRSRRLLYTAERCKAKMEIPGE